MVVTMSTSIKTHKSACAIRRMLDRPSLRTLEYSGSNSMRFHASDLDGRQFLEIVLSRANNEIECSVIDRGGRHVDSRVFHYADSEIVSLETRDRQTIENASALIRGIVSRHERPVDRETDARFALAERLREILQAHPEDAVEKIVDAISIASNPDGMSNIAEYLANDLTPAAL